MKLNFTKEGLLPVNEFRHLVKSMRVLGECVFYPSMGGKTIDGVNCRAVDMRVVDVEEIKDAMETIAQVYGLDVEFKQRSVNNEEN